MLGIVITELVIQIEIPDNWNCYSLGRGDRLIIK